MYVEPDFKAIEYKDTKERATRNTNMWNNVYINEYIKCLRGQENR